MRYTLALCLALVLNALANLMMKVGARQLGETGLSLDQGVGAAVARLLANKVLIVGLFCFATNVLFYAYALSGPRMNISVAYPIMVGGGFAIIAVVAWKFLGEVMSPLQWVGVGMILLGLILVAREMNSRAAA